MDPQAAAAQRRVDEAERLRVLAGHVYACFTSPIGAEVWKAIQAKTFLYTSTCDTQPGQRVDLEAMALNEGARTVGLYLLNLFERGKRGGTG